MLSEAIPEIPTQLYRIKLHPRIMSHKLYVIFGQ